MSQVMQQYFATADGYRRCSASVMGEWARFTRRKFKWSELRFETIFATPVIFLDVAYELRDANERSKMGNVIVLDGSQEVSMWPGLSTGRRDDPVDQPSWSVYGPLGHLKGRFPWEETVERAQLPQRGLLRRLSPLRVRHSMRSYLSADDERKQSEARLADFLDMDNDLGNSLPENEPVSWIPLMQSLQTYSSALRTCGLSTLQDVSTGSLRHGRVLVPAVRLSKKSWDFMPPEITKPYAVSNIRDIAIMIQSLGLTWTNFKPEEGILRAEGDGTIVTSAEIRSLGILISFTKTDKRIENRRLLHGGVFSPLEGAAALGFGIVNSDFPSNASYRIYSESDCLATIESLSSTRCSLLSHHNQHHNSNINSNITGLPRPTLELIILTIIGLITPLLRPQNTVLTHLVRPPILTPTTLPHLRPSLRAFHTSLSAHLLQHHGPSYRHQRSGPRAIQIAELCEIILGNKRWSDAVGGPAMRYQAFGECETRELVDFMAGCWRECNDWLSVHRGVGRRVVEGFVGAVGERGEGVLFGGIGGVGNGLGGVAADAGERVREEVMRFFFEVVRVRCLEEVVGSIGDEDGDGDGDGDAMEDAKAKKTSEEEVEEIWIAVLFRCVLWHAIHCFDDKVVAVPPRYHDSNLPVYIG
ncbi:hypothetical protein K402DRAFT_401049 [Aulographum hederae CBS 113979]|uniref:Uncharacterized protein n=1 Tax=Aulographum hederae CBS 113979 TaxID=1176131 RepID=A0A6G1HCG1_9PEZI|nr:hypothetical protein K402DRAFT_401049 [Aulographum hederae CBS 113979]